MEFISHHITPLIFTSLGMETQTQTQTHTHTHTKFMDKQILEIRHAPYLTFDNTKKNDTKISEFSVKTYPKSSKICLCGKVVIIRSINFRIK